jgi:hypothetical protein
VAGVSLSDYYGMDLRDLDVTTPEQAEGLRRYYRDAKDTVMPEYEFWLEHRPDVAKRRILFNMMCRSEEARRFMLPSLMGWIAYYTLTGYADGIVYQIANAQKVGAPRALIVDAFAVAQLFGDLERMGSIQASGADAYLADYRDPEPRPIFPDGWAHDPAAFRSGLDFSTPELSAAEGDMLRAWYRACLSEVPPWVERMLASAPSLLKAYRNRFEHALEVAPRQVMPYLLIHLNLLLGLRAGVREAFLLGRGFGMTREQLMDGIGRMVSYGGMAAVSIAVEVADDVFASYG